MIYIRWFQANEWIALSRKNSGIDIMIRPWDRVAGAVMHSSFNKTRSNVEAAFRAIFDAGAPNDFEGIFDQLDRNSKTTMLQKGMSLLSSNEVSLEDDRGASVYLFAEYEIQESNYVTTDITPYLTHLASFIVLKEILTSKVQVYPNERWSFIKASFALRKFRGEPVLVDAPLTAGANDRDFFISEGMWPYHLNEFEQIEELREEATSRSGLFGRFIDNLRSFSSFPVPTSFSEIQSRNLEKWRAEVTKPLVQEMDEIVTELREALADRHELSVHVRALVRRLDNAALEELLGENQGDLVTLYRAIHDAFDSHGLISPNKLAAVPKDVHRINQIETIIDLYNMKIHRTENDDTLPEGARARKLQALQHLMEKDIDALGGVI